MMHEYEKYSIYDTNARMNKQKYKGNTRGTDRMLKEILNERTDSRRKNRMNGQKVEENTEWTDGKFTEIQNEQTESGGK